MNHLGTYDANNETKFKILILRSGLYDYSDPYINFRGISNPKYRNRRGRRKQKRKVMFKNCAPFIK